MLKTTVSALLVSSVMFAGAALAADPAVTGQAPASAATAVQPVPQQAKAAETKAPAATVQKHKAGKDKVTQAEKDKAGPAVAPTATPPAAK